MAREAFNLGPKTVAPPGKNVRQAALNAVSGVAPGGLLSHISGQRHGRKTSQHYTGNATDADVYDAAGNKLQGVGDYMQPGFTDRMAKPAPSMQDVAMSFAAQNPDTAGIGLGPGYMGNDMSRMHMDLGGARVWGKTHSWPSMPAALRGNIANAREMGRFAQGLQPAVSSLPAAPAGTVTRNSLMDAAPNPDNVRATVSRNAFDTQRSAPEQGPPMSAFRQDRAVPQAPDAARFGPDPQQGPPMSSLEQDRVGATPLTGKQDRLGTPAPSARAVRHSGAIHYRDTRHSRSRPHDGRPQGGRAGDAGVQ